MPAAPVLLNEAVRLSALRDASILTTAERGGRFALKAAV